MNRRFPWIVTACVIVLSVVFISPESLWLDEGHTAYRALFGDFHEWYKKLVEGGNSDSMMPGYMLIMWGWIKVTGVHEFALRSSNMLWLAISVLAYTRFRCAWFCLLCSPFVLYYLSELRPYSMQIAGGALIISSFAGNGLSDRKSGWVFLAGGWILCASSLTGIVWAVGAGMFQLALRPGRLFEKRFLLDCAWVSPAFLILAIHYLNPALRGQGPAPWGGNLLVSLGAAGYELIGLSGLGPGRNELREDPSSVRAFIVPISIGILALGIPIVVGAVDWFRTTTRRTLLAALIGIGLPMMFFVVLCLAKDFRFLGRHLAPAAPIVSLCIARLFSTHGPNRLICNGLATAALTLGLVSALSLRFSERHRKDDYRTAAALAIAYMQNGRRVVWCADSYVASVYNTPGKFEGTGSWNAWTFHVPGQTLDGGEMVFVSKPDIYDQKGELRKQLADNKFAVASTLTAFQIYENPRSPAAD